MATTGGPTAGPVRMRMDESVTRQRIRPGTVRRVIPFVLQRRWAVAALLAVTAVDATIAASGPLLLKMLIDDGIGHHRVGTVVALSSAMAGLAIVNAVAGYLQAWFSGRVGHGLVCDLRTKVFDHLQRQPMAFFTRAQTGSLISRINGDVIGTQQAVTTLLSQSLSILLTLVLVLASLFYLSWQLTLLSLLLIPLFLVPGRFVGSRLQRIAREGMQVDAEIGSLMSERFNVGGALLSKLYGRPEEESRAFASRASRMRDLAVLGGVYGRLLGIVASLIVALATAIVYGIGGTLVVHGTLQVGTLVAVFALLSRLFGPVQQLNSIQIDVVTTLVSFDRVFEVLDLEPLVVERPGARALPAAAAGEPAPDIEFTDVHFRYPSAAEVSLPSLESIQSHVPERADGTTVLHGLSFHAPAGKVTALVGPSGAGKTTITQLVPRLYDPVAGTVRIGGHDVRDLTLRSLHETIGVVTQDAHLFHDSLRANMAFARPEATEEEMIEACRAARIWDTIAALPNGLDTVVGDRGHRMSGGEKQRIALARLLLKSPPVVVLDEATAHLDSESEAAIQRALEATLVGRTSLVIAHRLSTVRNADQILVIDAGRVRERGTHDELLATDGLYAELYRTQFATQHPGDPGIDPTVRTSKVG